MTGLASGDRRASSVDPGPPPNRVGADGDRVLAVDACAFTVPTDRPEADGTLAWDQTTVVVARVSAGGFEGIGWTYSSEAIVGLIRGLLGDVVVGSNPFDIVDIHERMIRALRNLGRRGLAATAVSALDIALWDLKARLLHTPLAGLFGRCRRSVPVYGSGGFTTYDDHTTIEQLRRWVADDGVDNVKIKIGEDWGRRLDRDRRRVALARATIGPDIGLFVDANGAYRAHEAIRLGRRLWEESGIVWFEEPVSSDDTAGLREVRLHLPVDVAAGEYGFTEDDLEQLLLAEAVDCLQIDVTRCGGYTSWLRAAALAAARNIEVSGHCAPTLHAHVAAAVPNLRHVELFHDHRRVDAILFDGTLEPECGVLTPNADVPGHGLSLRTGAVDRYRVA